MTSHTVFVEFADFLSATALCATHRATRRGRKLHLPTSLSAFRERFAAVHDAANRIRKIGHPDVNPAIDLLFEDVIYPLQRELEYVIDRDDGFIIRLRTDDLWIMAASLNRVATQLRKAHGHDPFQGPSNETMPTRKASHV